MRRKRRWAVAVLVASLIVDAAMAFAQDPPPRRQQVQTPARAKAVRNRPARRKPRGDAPGGSIVPYPFPPALIIRQTPEAHDEVRALLNMLRYH